MPFWGLPEGFAILRVQVVPVSKTNGCVTDIFGCSASIDTAPYMHLYTDLLNSAPIFGDVILTLDVFNCPAKASFELKHKTL